VDDKIILFGDNKKINADLRKKLTEYHIAAEISAFSAKHWYRNIDKIIEAAKGKSVALVFKNEDLKSITEIFHKKGIADIYVCPWDTHFPEKDDAALSEYFIRIDNNKPRLNYLEIELSASCNLNCKGCFQFSNLVEGNSFADISVFGNDLEKLRELFWGIGEIRLLGGEPLLNLDFLLFIKTARKIFPDSDLRLVSNGLLIPDLSNAELAEIKKLNCTINISNYPPTQNIIDTITSRLREAGISFYVSLPINMFYKELLAKPSKSPDGAFNNCIFTHCHALSNGKLAACSHQLYIDRLNTTFNLDYPTEGANEIIDIYLTELDGWEIDKLFDKPHNFCRYCSKGMVPYKWKAGTKNNAQAADWIIEPTALNTKILPIVQSILKSPAKTLRHFISRPKSNR
jgi:hypothetical protein